jgi:hypothetical protein
MVVVVGGAGSCGVVWWRVSAAAVVIPVVS